MYSPRQGAASTTWCRVIGSKYSFTCAGVCLQWQRCGFLGHARSPRTTGCAVEREAQRLGYSPEFSQAQERADQDGDAASRTGFHPAKLQVSERALELARTCAGAVSLSNARKIQTAYTPTVQASCIRVTRDQDHTCSTRQSLSASPTINRLANDIDPASGRACHDEV